MSAGGFSFRLFHLVHEEHWTQHVREPTRYHAGQRPSMLNLVFTSLTGYKSMNLLERVTTLS